MPGSVFDVMDFGAIGDGVADDYPAFQRALDAIAGLSKIARPGFPNSAHIEIKDPSGAMLWVPHGKYRLSKTLRLNRQTIVQGVGASSSRLTFPLDVDGIVIESSYTSAPENDTVDASGKLLQGGHGTGAGSVIRDIGIVGGLLFGRSNPPIPAINEDDPLTALPVSHTGHLIVAGHGVVFCSPALIENCRIENFHYDGVHIETIDTIPDLVEETGEPFSGADLSSVTTTTKSANGWQVRNCFIYGNGRHAIFTAGDNSNAGMMLGGTMQNNAGWAVYDRSQFGNNYFGCIAEANGHYSANTLLIAVDPNTPGRLFACTADAGVFKSGDDTQGWAALNTGLGDFERIPRIQALVIEPRGLYIGTNGGRVLDQTNPSPKKPLNRVVFQSKDKGKTWFAVGSNRNGLTSANVRALVHFGVTPAATLYAATADKGVFKGVITPVAGDAAPDTIVWTAINTGLTNPNVAAIAIHPGTPEAVLYIGTTGGVFKSLNAGANWSETGLATGDVQALVIDPSNNNTVYAATKDRGVLKTTDGGATWVQANAGLFDQGQLLSDVRALAIDPTNHTVLYVGTNGHGVFKTRNSAVDWNVVPGSKQGTAAGVIQTLAIDLANPLMLYVGTNAGLFKADQANALWAPYRPFYGGGYKATGTNAANVFVGCYAESDQAYGSELAAATLFLGGLNGGGFNFTTEAGILATSPGGPRIMGLTLKSSIAHAVRTIRSTQGNDSAGVFPDDSVILVDAFNGNILLSLPAQKTTPAGSQFTVKKIDGELNAVTLRPKDGAAIDGIKQDIRIDTQNSGVIIVSDGTSWQTLGKF